MKKLYLEGWNTPLTKIMLFILGLLFMVYMFYKWTMFTNAHIFNWHSPIEIKLFVPVKVEKRTEGYPTPTKGVKPQKSALQEQIKVSRSQTSKAEDAIYIYFGDSKIARAVARAESGMNCESVSRTSDYGLFQIHLPLHQWRFDKFDGDPMDCWDSARVAYEIQSEQGFRPWTAYTSGAYKKFLTYEK